MSSDALSTTFAALADPTRRAILARLALGETSVTELAEPFRHQPAGHLKHLKVLERAGLIARGREAQWRPCRISPDWPAAGRRLAGKLSPALEPAPGSPGNLSPGVAGQGRQASRHGGQAWPKKVTSISGRTLRVMIGTRVLDAPRTRVFDIVVGPEPSRAVVGAGRLHDDDQRLRHFCAGGVWRFVMHGPDGRDY